MIYHVVFDASQNGSQLAIWLLLIPLAATLPGLIGWALKNSDEEPAKTKSKLFIAVSGIAFAFSVVFAVGHYTEYHQAKKALETGNYQFVEGTVTDFVPMPPGGHSIESFKVGNTEFKYGSGWGSITFNSEWNRGFIRNGSQVRISYKNEDILRIELR